MWRLWLPAGTIAVSFLLPNYYLYLLSLAGVWAIAALGLNLLLWLAAQAMLVGFTTWIQYVMVVNGLALLGFALWPSAEQMYRLE